MCGIVGYIGKNTKECLIEKLKKLEYRGYDSAGVSMFCGKKIKTYKACGKISVLEKKLCNINQNFTSGIGHTRWATHGKPSNKNSHPHNNKKNTISIVHNGIIENYIELKEKLIKMGKVFISETDSEVIAHLLDTFNANPVEMLQGLKKILVGSYAIVAIFSSHPNEIFAITNSSPLILGVGKDATIIASDITALIGSCDKIYRLEDGEVVHFSKDKIELFGKNEKAKSIDWKKIDYNQNQISLQHFSSFMEKEIHEIPSVILNTFSTLQKQDYIQNFLKICPKEIGTLHFIGCGSALHSGLVAKMHCDKLGIYASTHYASEFRYSTPPMKNNDICVFISQSGETADTLEAVKIAKQRGLTTVAVTNHINSSIVSLCDCVVPLVAGVEIAVASTKAYNAQVVALLTLICAISMHQGKESFDLKNDLVKLVNTINVDKFNSKIEKICNILAKKEHIFFIGKDFDYCTALEGALKLKEISYIHCEAFPAGELKHGTLALVDSKSVVIAISTQTRLQEKILNALNEVKSRGAYTILITHEQVTSDAVDETLLLDKIPEYLYPLLSVIPCQLLALKTAQNKKLDPDKPRNLAKSVTVE